MQQLNDDSGDNNLALSLLVLVLAAIGILAMTALVALGADSNCLTREEARAKYPGAYLYWRTPAKCWYARSEPGRGNPNQSQSRPVRPPVKAVRWLEYNELDAQADRDTYFESATLPIWRLAPIPKSRFKPWDERIGM